ncbi:dolichyl-diphosphooligosaccharide--protein glycosyltransferase subunit DAD1 [Acipenser oxyrinchus oxyrinchus]|uniref:Dolichyl-diphosphooligosaccharide--protein glycosyltransferase subunit DAD1 n=1 Tax=Acipenser oxyrinchus oxyrinchus TaxID=40147 RepID=A0AAD8CM32_ACIOX|nr:dolichyl-diphosphooligosaccharide--protein glycosyltransferase subunit DAD1 [Acipenser oxyrinchus oxyrinchus]
MSNSVLSVISRFLDEYVTSTPNKLKLVDAYLLYIVLTGAMQFLYCLLVGTFPFNSFLSGFISSVGCFILAVCLRIQVNPNNKDHGHFTGSENITVCQPSQSSPAK